jgi:serine O-acetyltransferase
MNDPATLDHHLLEGSVPAHGEETNMLKQVVEELCAADNGSAGSRRRQRRIRLLPSRNVVIETVEAIKSVLFPGYFGRSELKTESLRYHVGSTLDHVLHTLQDQVERGLCFVSDEGSDHYTECHTRAVEITRRFIARLPGIQRLLATDVQATYEGDPAATSPDETIFCYPGIQAITNYRLAHELYRSGVPLIPRIITEQAHSVTGIDIHPGATIGESFFIDHGTGVVIGETCIVGNNVRIYQGVTLGARSFSLDENGRPQKGIDRHPIVEDDVVIYSGATILGRIVIGKGSVIGGNVWLTRSVPPFSRITQAQSPRAIFENGAGI